jgi:hypothetical protein
MQKQEEKTWDWFVARYNKLGYTSLNKFANENGYQKSSLSRYFHLQRQIPSGTMASLCQTLKVSTNEMMKAIGEDWK